MKESANRFDGAGITAVALIAIALITYLAAFFTLNGAIQWPASLRYPPDKMLPLLLENQSAVFRGYYFYLISSLLLIPLMHMTSLLLDQKSELSGLLMRSAAGMAVASAVFRALGIIRWEFAMPYLANLSAGGMADVSAHFFVLNEYAGKVGEHLGVGLSASLMLVFFGFSLLAGRRGKKLAILSFVVAFLNLPMRDYFDGVPGWYLTAAANFFLVWLIAVAASFKIRATQ